MISKKNYLFKIVFAFLLTLGLGFWSREEVWAACDGTGAKWTLPPKAEPYEYQPWSKLETEAILTNISDEGGFGNFTIYFNGWNHKVPITAGTHTVGTPGDKGWSGTTITFTLIEQDGKPAWRVRTVIPLAVGYLYRNNIRYEWNDSTNPATATVCGALQASYCFSQVDACGAGEGSGHEWILTTGDTPYSPGSIAVTSIKLVDWQGITDDISFFFDGWEFKLGGDNGGWAEGSELTATGKSGDTERIVTMKVPIVAGHSDGHHRISYRWAITNSLRRCSVQSMILVSNPGVTAPVGGGNTGRGGSMPKTGLLDDVNKTVFLGVGLVVLGVTWTLVLPLIKKNKQVYLVASTPASRSIRTGGRPRFSPRANGRRSKFEKKI